MENSSREGQATDVMRSHLQPEFMIPLSRTGYLMTAIYLTIIGSIATVGNIAVICVLSRYGTFQKRSINLLLINMAIGDLGVSVIGYPLTTLSGYWGRWLFGDVACQLYAFCVYTLSCNTISTHAVISIYRYIYIVKTSLRPKLSTNITLVVIGGIWIYALFWSVTPFIGWSSYVYEPFGTSCSVNWMGRTFNDMSYMVACTFGVYLLQMFVMLFCYLRVAKKVRGINPGRIEERDAGVIVFGKMRRREGNIDTHVTKMCFTMMISFIIVWAPYAFESLWSAHSRHVSALAAVLPTMCAKSSCMLNPVIFITSSSKFRRDLRKLLSRPRAKETIGIQERVKRSFYVRKNALSSAQGSLSASVYYHKERVYIGEMSASRIQREAELLQRDADRISIASSSSSDMEFVVKDRIQRFHGLTEAPGPRGADMFAASGSIMASQSSTLGESKSQSTSSGTWQMRRTDFGSRKASKQYSQSSSANTAPDQAWESGEIFTLDGSVLQMMSLR